MKTKLITTIMITLFLASMLSMAFVAPVAATPDSSIVGLWHFNEGIGSTAYDSSGFDNDGTLSGGKFGNALEFDGTDDYVRVPGSTSLDITDKITVEAWIKPKSPYSIHGDIVRRQKGYQLCLLTSGKIEVTLWFGGNPAFWLDSISTIPIPATRFYHVAFTYDKDVATGNLKIYIDGALDAEYTVAQEPITPWGVLGIGAVTDGGQYWWFTGIIDEVRISNIARTTFDLTSAPIADANTVALWHFDESVDPTVYDEADTSDADDGTIYGAKWAGPIWVDGKFGKALSFNGNDYVSVADSASLDAIVDLTVKLWLNPAITYEPGAPDFYVFVSKFGPGSFQFVYHPAGYLYLYVTGGMAARSSPVTLSAGTWYHLAATFDSGTSDSHIYVDGNDVTLSTTTQTMTTNDSPLFIGARPSPTPPYPKHFVKGIIDEVRIYDIALLASEIRLEYEMLDKTLSASEGLLGDLVHVTIEAFNPGYELEVEDTIPKGFHYITDTLTGDPATPTIEENVISYTSEVGGVHVIGFDVKVDEAKSWEDMEVYNVASATWYLDGEIIYEKVVTESFIIHPFEELQKGARPILFSDNFQSYDIGSTGSPTWTIVGGGTWGVEYDPSPNRVLSAQIPSFFALAYAGDMAWTDFIYQVKVKKIPGLLPPPSERYPDIFFRYQDFNNFYYVQLRDSTGTWDPNKLGLYARKAGGWQTIQIVSATIAPDTWYTVKIAISGTPPSIKVYLKGGAYSSETLMIDATDTLPPLTHGAIGVGAWQSHAHFDDVLVTGPLVPVKEKTNVQWAIEIEVANPFSYTMTDVVITDRFGAEIEIDLPFPYSITHGTVSYTTSGKSAKVFLTWSIGNLLPGETARLIILVSTDINPSGKQEYTTPGIYELNSGATLKFIDPEQDIQLSAYTDSIYVTVLPAEDPA